MIRVGVVRGGPSGEYEFSLETGGNVISCLKENILEEHDKPVDIFIDKDGVWHKNGVPTDIEKVFNSVDVVFNALHGEYGEDGKIQQVFNEWKIPYTGSGSFSSALGFNKALLKRQFDILGIKTPKHLLFEAYQEDFDKVRGFSQELSKIEYSKRKAKEVLNKIHPPWVVKPLTGNSVVQIYLCKTFEDLVVAFIKIIDTKSSILVEEYIEGKGATVLVIENFRNQDLYTLPATEIRISKDRDLSSDEIKYVDKREEICPGNFTQKEKEDLMQLAKLIHRGFSFDHYSKSNFVIHPKKGIYALSVNTLPNLAKESQVHKGLSAVGSNIVEFIDHLIKLAKNRKF